MKLFNRRSAPKEPGESLASKIRRRSRSRPRPSQLPPPEEDRLSAAFAQQSMSNSTTNGTTSANGRGSSGRSRISGPAPERQLPDALQNGMLKEEVLPGQAITIDNDNDIEYHAEEHDVAGRSSASLKDASGRSRSISQHRSIYAHPKQGVSQSSRIEDDLADHNAKLNQGVPPVPPIPRSTTDKSSPTVSDAQTQHSFTTAGSHRSNPIASEVCTPSPIEKERRAKRKSKFSSASYYMRQNSPPPSFGQLHDSLTIPHPNEAYKGPQSETSSYSNQTPNAGRSSADYLPTQGRLYLNYDPVMVGSTAAAGTRNAPNYADRRVVSLQSGKNTENSQESHARKRRSLPTRKPVGGHSTSSSTEHERAPSESINHSAADDAASSRPEETVSITSNSHANATSDSDTEPRPQQGGLYDGKPLLIEGASEPPSLEGVLNLQNSVQTTVHTRHEPAVYHDTIRPEIHHVRHEHTQRDIHNHEVHHRVLPIKEVQVLAAKHYAPVGSRGELVEIDESQVPHLADRDRRFPVNDSGHVVSMGPIGDHERFTTKDLSSGEGEHKEYVNQRGVPTTETTWIHQPTLDMGQHKRQNSEGKPSGVESTTNPQNATPGSLSTGSQPAHERRAEAAVAANVAGRRTTSGAHSNPNVNGAAFHGKPRVEQEMAAARVAAQRAIGHVPGAFEE